MFSIFPSRCVRAGVAAAALALVPSIVGAQPASRTRFGALLGVSSTSISNADLEGAAVGVSSETKRRVGFQIGAYLTRSLSGNLSFQPEVHYIQKGAKIDVSINDDADNPFFEGTAGRASAEASIKFAYLEVPLLLRYDVNRAQSVRPFLVVGPSVAMRISCNIGIGFEGASLNTDCADANDGEASSEDPFEKFDAGLMVGGGISGIVSKLPVSLQVRYSHGLVNIAKDGADGRSPRNTGISLLFGIEF